MHQSNFYFKLKMHYFITTLYVRRTPVVHSFYFIEGMIILSTQNSVLKKLLHASSFQFRFNEAFFSSIQHSISEDSLQVSDCYFIERRIIFNNTTHP